MPKLLDTLAAQLEHPRELSVQVVRHVSGTYGIDREDVGRFLVDELPKLEEDEHDLILSPLFTPKLGDQAIFAELLGRDSVLQERWPELIRELAARPTRAQLVASDGQTYGVLLRDVALERYVHRLRLDATIPESIFTLLNQAPVPDRPMLKAVARRAVWENNSRRQILETYLQRTVGGDFYRLTDAVDLLGLVESYQPTDPANLLDRLPRWQQTLQDEINQGSTTKPFFSATIQNSHGGERDQRHQDDSRITAKKNELAFLERLQKILGSGSGSEKP